MIVDDNSPDGTSEIVENLKEKNNNLYDKRESNSVLVQHIETVLKLL